LNGPWALAVSGTRFYEVTRGGIFVTDPSSDPSPNWYQVPVACKKTEAALAAAGNNLIYAYALPQPDGSNCVASNVWHLMMVDASSGSARATKHTDLRTITDAASSPLVAISTNVYAFAYQQTASNAIVEVHALQREVALVGDLARAIAVAGSGWLSHPPFRPRFLVRDAARSVLGDAELVDGPDPPRATVSRGCVGNTVTQS
jgi:hypothetical protein